MGLRKYGFIIRTAEDAEYLLQMLLDLNESENKFWKTKDRIYDTGSEPVHYNTFLNFKEYTYVSIGAGGGNATDWIENYYKTHGKALETYYPWENPAWCVEPEGRGLDGLACDEEVKKSLCSIKNMLDYRKVWQLH